MSAGQNKKFTDWSVAWKDCRKRSNTAQILKLWQNPLPQNWKRKIWEGKLGYRKRSDDKGEQQIEARLLNCDGGVDVVLDSKTIQLKAIYHNFPLANQRSGQVIADAFGVLEAGNTQRTLMIEVKVSDRNPWYALVENLQQVRLARACAQEVTQFVKKQTGQSPERGTWGLVLAPKKYYERHGREAAACKHLLEELKKRTQARVAFGISDFLAEGKIVIRASNWF